MPPRPRRGSSISPTRWTSRARRSTATRRALARQGSRLEQRARSDAPAPCGSGIVAVGQDWECPPWRDHDYATVVASPGELVPGSADPWSVALLGWPALDPTRA